MIRNNIRTMVACSAGMSRSPAIAAAALGVATQRPLEECRAAIIADGPRDVSPILWARVTEVYSRIVVSGR